LNFRSVLTKLAAGLDPNSPILIRDMPVEERPRERMILHGPDALKPSELLAILLRTGSKGVSAIELGERLIRQYGTLEQLACAPLADLQRMKGIGRDKAIALKSAFTLAQKMALELRRESPVLDRPEPIVELLREELRDVSVERFHSVLLNTRRRLIRIERLSEGLLDTILIHPREVFRSAISANAASLVLVHNHPSGDPTPSDADLRATRDLIRAGQLLKIEVADHIIIGARAEGRPKDFSSLKELGYFYA